MQVLKCGKNLPTCSTSQWRAALATLRWCRTINTSCTPSIPPPRPFVSNSQLSLIIPSPCFTHAHALFQSHWLPRSHTTPLCQVSASHTHGYRELRGVDSRLQIDELKVKVEVLLNRWRKRTARRTKRVPRRRSSPSLKTGPWETGRGSSRVTGRALYNVRLRYLKRRDESSIVDEEIATQWRLTTEENRARCRWRLKQTYRTRLVSLRR